MPIRNFPFHIAGPGQIARPYLPINIINPATGLSQRFWGLIDTGADCCAAPARLATLLGHDLHAGQLKQIITGNGMTNAYGHTTTIQIFDHSNQSQVIYTKENIIMDYMPNLGPVLLGVEGFLSTFILTIDYRRLVFSITNS